MFNVITCVCQITFELFCFISIIVIIMLCASGNFSSCYDAVRYGRREWVGLISLHNRVDEEDEA